jgi:hypothetical protein
MMIIFNFLYYYLNEFALSINKNISLFYCFYFFFNFRILFKYRNCILLFLYKFQ